MHVSTPPPAPRLGDAALIAERYELLGLIAQGGMATVHRALDRVSGAEVALKRATRDNSATWELALLAFEREYQVLSAMDHPRTIRALDYGIDEQGPFYTMELVAGRDLAALAPLPWQDVCLHLRDLATCLSLLHARRLLHRDLSPRNVRIDQDGRCKLLDFGALGEFGYANAVIGTAPMIPPEAVRGEYLDQRADLYSLGALGYWALTGRHAHDVRKIAELPDRWNEPTPHASAVAGDVPPALDALLASLMSVDVMARPSSTAEVIARLDVIGELPVVGDEERRRLAFSFLASPPFVGRDSELAQLTSDIQSARAGVGRACRITAAAGVGRSRLLTELGLNAQLAGCVLLRADASHRPQQNGVVRELVLRLANALPELARTKARSHAPALRALGSDVERRLGLPPTSDPPRNRELRPEPPRTIADWFIEVSHQAPLVVLIDNLELVDPPSLAVLLALAVRVSSEPIMLVLAERSERQDTRRSFSLLRSQCVTLSLGNLRSAETSTLARSLFGPTLHVERFGEWLHELTDGNPLHCIELTRRLIAQDLVRYEGGIWLLPMTRPQIALPAGLEGALVLRMRELRPASSELARCLSLLRGEATRELCLRLASVDASAGRTAEHRALGLLDELVRHDVLRMGASGYGFTSSALRDAIRRDTGGRRAARLHARLGEAYQSLSADDPNKKLEAGWHFINAGEDLRGAELISEVLSGTNVLYGMVADGLPIGPYAERALQVYKDHRRSPYQRAPLLCALALASFWENYEFLGRYGDEALDLAEQLIGLGAVRTLSRWIGSTLAVVVAFWLSWWRFMLQPRNTHRGSFPAMMLQMHAVFPPLVGATTLALDSERAMRITRMLAPYRRLPRRSSLRATYDYCLAVQELGRENLAKAVPMLTEIGERLSDPARVPLFPAAGRRLVVTGTYIARGIFGVLQADGKNALQMIHDMENVGMRLHTVIASQLRYLYHALRGELSLAQQQREQVEVHAAQLGMSWQIDLWEPAALLPLRLATGDLVGMAQTMHRFDELVRFAPALSFYRRLAELQLGLLQDGDIEQLAQEALHFVDAREPRSFIGWTGTVATIAAGYNRLGQHKRARELCERGIRLITDADREYVSLFLEVELQASIADAALGEGDRALARLEHLRVRHEASGHPLALGRIHALMARLALQRGRRRAYLQHKQQMEFYLRPTENPPLIALCEEVSELQRSLDTPKDRRR
jgi:hypothetical protein